MAEKPPVWFYIKTPERLSEFLEELDLYIDFKGVTNEIQKRGILCQFICVETKRRLREWIHPLTLTLCPYVRLIEVLKDNIKPSVNRDVLFNTLVTRFQQEGESGEAYAAELMRLSENLDFGWNAKLLVTYQLKRGVKDRLVQERLYGDPEITLEKAIELIKAAESSKACISSLQQVSEVNLMYSKRKSVRNKTIQNQAQKPNGKQVVNNSKPSIYCYRCGESGHVTKSCSHKYKECVCTHCKKVGHLVAACKGKKTEKKKAETNLLEMQIPLPVLHNYSDLEGGFSDLYSIRCDLQVDPLFITLMANGKEVTFQIDDGAAKTVMSESEFRRTFGDIPLESARVALTTWGSKEAIFETYQAYVEVTFRGKTFSLPIIITKDQAGDTPNLLGRNWISALYGPDFLEKSYQVGRYAVHNLQSDPIPEVTPGNLLRWVHTFPAVSGKGTGRYNGPPAHFGVPPGTQPKYHYARSVPFALSARVEEAIDAKVAAGVWVPVEPTEVSWATALVPIPKKNGEIRLCADYKSTINPVLQPDTYTSPSVNEILAMAAGCEVFAELDAKEAYLQIPLTLETSMLMVVNTKKGLFRPTTLQFGVKVAPGIFQRIMDGLLGSSKQGVLYPATCH
ncbi:hypothetical protein KUF71_014570 [Frankliniella fusca]|uniref:CCHC-type domain-containing protein n=1 Tax=Frankliniella fusca TaxID=407009 RepID=A0AAE1HRZ5_9NEOP|nr:hypothetical protein KUF71_014570 [Frankliniella fusca]